MAVKGLLWRVGGLLLLCYAHALRPQKHYPDVPIMRLEDHNVSYLQLSGQDAELDFLHSVPEDILLRIFLAAQYDKAGNIKVRGTILREPLAEVPQFGVMGCSDHVWQCPGHKWRPNITLVEPSLGLNFSMQFMDEADGVADYMKPCGKDGKMGPWDNVMPYSAQATLPPSAANITFHFRLQGWSSQGLYTVKPQTLQVEEPTSARRQVWNIMKSPSSDTDPTAYAVNLAHNVRYHEAVGYAGNLAIVTFNDVLGLLANPLTAKLIESGSLKLLLWEGYWGCEGFPRCSAQEQFAIEYAVAYQPLQFSVIALFLWPYRPYLSFADVDEFLLIQKPGQNVTDLIADPACFNGAHQIGVPHHQIQTKELMQPSAHWRWWHESKIHTFHEVLANYVYRSVKEDEPPKAIVLAERVVASAVHSMQLDNAGITIRGSAECAVWGHIKDLWSFRDSFRLIPRIYPQEQDGHEHWINWTEWQWALRQPTHQLSHQRHRVL